MSGEHEVVDSKFDVQEIWHKGQRVLRTALTTALTALPLVPQIIQIVQGQWSAEWLTGIGVQAVAINAALTGIIAIPKINAWLTVIGLGSVPRAVAKETAAAKSQELQPAQFAPSQTDIRTEQGEA